MRKYVQMDIKNLDALELLNSLGDKSVGLTLTDPPYNKLLKLGWDIQWETKAGYLFWLDNMVKGCQRVLKECTSLYVL